MIDESGISESLLVTPFGRVVLLYDGRPILYYPHEVVTDDHCPDVNGRYKITFDYICDQGTHKLSCIVDIYGIDGVQVERESGECLEALAFYIDDKKMTIGVYGEEPGYVDGVINREHDFGYDVAYVDTGLVYEIKSSTESGAFVFGISWIYPCTEENDHQTWFAADPWTIGLK